MWTITEGGELFLEYTKPLSLLTMFGSRTQRLAPFIFKSGLTVFWMTPDISPYMGTENLPMVSSAAYPLPYFSSDTPTLSPSNLRVLFSRSLNEPLAKGLGRWPAGLPAHM